LIAKASIRASAEAGIAVIGGIEREHIEPVEGTRIERHRNHEMTGRKQSAGVWIHINLYYGNEETASAGVVKNTWIRDKRPKRRAHGAGYRINRRFRPLLKEEIERQGIARTKEVVAAGVIDSDRVVDRFNYEFIAYGETLVRRLEFAVDAVRSGKSQVRLLKLRQPDKTREIAINNGLARGSRNMSGPHARRTVIAVRAWNIETFINLDTLPEEPTGK